MTVKIGEQNMAHYRATNTSDQSADRHGRVQRDARQAGAYFNKIQCFCFTEQTLQPGETVDMPVVVLRRSGPCWTIRTPRAIKEITLSYTFYPVDKPKTVSAASRCRQTSAN